MIRRRQRLRAPADAGVTLIEVMVAMAVMSIVSAVFTTALVQAYRSVNTGETTSITQTQLRLAVQTLDGEVRYSSGVTVPNTTAVGGAWYVEFLGIDSRTGVQVCRQLRLNASGVLQQLTWTPGSPPAAGTAGRTLASGLVQPGGTVALPFERQTPGSLPYAMPSTGTAFTPDYQRLRLRLTTRQGTTTSVSDVTFSALNTSRETTDPNICIEGRPS